MNENEFIKLCKNEIIAYYKKEGEITDNICLEERDVSEDSFYDVNIKFKDGNIRSESIRDIKELRALLENIKQEPIEVRLKRVKR